MRGMRSEPSMFPYDNDMSLPEVMSARRNELLKGVEAACLSYGWVGNDPSCHPGDAKDV